MGSIVWNGVSSRAIPLVVENPPHYVSAEREYDVQHIPGRNGDLLKKSETFNNVECSFDVAFGSTEKPHSEIASAASEWLRAPNGYARLENSYEPDYYRMAYYQQETDFENVLNCLGHSTISFNCMPQRFLKSGDTLLTFDLKTVPAGTMTRFRLRNPTSFSSCPLIYIYGTGGLTINANTVPKNAGVETPKSYGQVKVINLDGSAANRLLIDCERDGYYCCSDPSNLPSPELKWNIWGGKYIDFSVPYGSIEPVTTSLRFPPSNVEIQVQINSGSFDRIEVVPKWYTI